MAAIKPVNSRNITPPDNGYHAVSRRHLDQLLAAGESDGSTFEKP
jgi:hypothetical protein